jgi:hypothetical protein
MQSRGPIAKRFGNPHFSRSELKNFDFGSIIPNVEAA